MATVGLRAALRVLGPTVGLTLLTHVSAAPGQLCVLELQKLTAPDASTGDRFGSSVSASGDRVVDGAYTDDDTATSSGSAYIFRRDDNGTPSDPTDAFWLEEAKLTAMDASEYFGNRVSMSGDWVIVGVDQDDDAGSGSGSANVFRRDENSTPSEQSDDHWVAETKITVADAYLGAYFGRAFSIEDECAVVSV